MGLSQLSMQGEGIEQSILDHHILLRSNKWGMEVKRRAHRTQARVAPSHTPAHHFHHTAQLKPPPL